MPNYERPISSLSLRTINNLRSEMYQMQRRCDLFPSHPDRPIWLQRVEKIRSRLGEEVVPLSRRQQISPIEREMKEDKSAQQAASDALDELERALQDEVSKRTEPTDETRTGS